RRHTRSKRDWSSDVCSSDLDFRPGGRPGSAGAVHVTGHGVFHIDRIFHCHRYRRHGLHQRSADWCAHHWAGPFLRFHWFSAVCRGNHVCGHGPDPHIPSQRHHGQEGVFMSKSSKRLSFWIIAAIIVLLVCLAFITPSRIVLDYVIRLAAFVVFATSLNFLVGYGGMVSFGHAMFFGAGAYAFGLLIQKGGVSVPLAIVGTLGFCALVAVVIGAICVQLKEIYFAFLTLAFQMLFYSIILTWTSLTGGDQGLMGGIRREPFLGIDLGQYLHLYWFACT